MAEQVDHPWATKPAPEKFVIEIIPGDGMRSPIQVAGAVSRAMLEYSHGEHGRYTAPFTQQPGYPQGVIKNRDGVIVGSWKLTGAIR